MARFVHFRAVLEALIEQALVRLDQERDPIAVANLAEEIARARRTLRTIDAYEATGLDILAREAA